MLDKISFKAITINILPKLKKNKSKKLKENRLII